MKPKFTEFILFVDGHMLWFHSTLFSFLWGSGYFLTLSLLFAMTEYYKYKIKITGMTPSKEAYGQILGFNYFIILLLLFSLSHLSMLGEVWIPLGATK